MNADVALRHGFADLDGVRLHYVEAGEGPLVVLLHGYPEFWWSWRHQIPALASAGFRVVAPDLRGYGQSDKPRGTHAYDGLAFTADIAGLIEERGAREAHVVGHDWGGAVAWTLAMHVPERVASLSILNVPHPRRVLGAIHDPRQIARSWYMLAFQIPWLADRLIEARDFGWRRRQLRHGATTAEEMPEYLREWRRPGATRAMTGHYRMLFRRTPRQMLATIRPIRAPTLVIWGERDHYLRKQIADPPPADVPNLVRTVRLPNATHWVHHDEPATVNTLLVEHLERGAARRQTSQSPGSTIDQPPSTTPQPACEHPSTSRPTSRVAPPRRSADSHRGWARR